MPADDSEGNGGRDNPMQTAAQLVDIQGFMRAHAIRAGVELGVFDLLESTPQSSDAIAEELGTHPANTYRLLRALASTGALEEEHERHFSLTDVGRCFRSDSTQSVVNRLRFWWSPELKAVWSHLPAIVENGGPDGFEREFDRPLMEYLGEDARFAAAYNGMMSDSANRRTVDFQTALAAYDFSTFSHVCDLGGGHGRLLCELLDTHPHLEGTVLDLPHVIEETDERFAPAVGVEERCTYVAGDLFESVPEADAYIMQTVLHGFSDTACVEALSSVSESAPPEARLFVSEVLVPEPGESDFSKLMDVQMLVTGQGRERTESEYCELLDRADWEHLETHSSGDGLLSVIEARPT